MNHHRLNPKAKSGLGSSLINAQKKKRKPVTKHGFIHSTEVNDGLDWARLNLRSVTEQTSVDDFLDKVKLADREYSQEFGNIKILTESEARGEISESEKKLIKEAQETNRDVLCIPRRPDWDFTTSKEELDSKEKSSFYDWRRKLALLREEKHIHITPYEKNLEIWRQLWRVVEKSDVIVQILDARNPLLFRCSDLELYVKEIDKNKRNILLLNKADFLSEEQRRLWAEYFKEQNVESLFFSALQQTEPTKEDSPRESEGNSSTDDESDSQNESESVEEKSEICESAESNNEEGTKEIKELFGNSEKLFSKDDLISYFKQFRKPGTDSDDNMVTTIGLVGYPNVGKSSTINAVLSSKKVQVSATPGKTKHFQTLMLDPKLCLCDCPGLVFPSFVSSKADMIINGILPIDNLTEAFAPVNLVCEFIPRTVLEANYSIMLPHTPEGQNESLLPTAEELLSAYGYMRGFMTPRGLPDTSRSARYILKDFVNGKLLYCCPPPDVDSKQFQNFSIKPEIKTLKRDLKTAFIQKMSKSDEIDRNFFSKNTGQIHVKGSKPIPGNAFGYTSNVPSNNEGKKPWKKHYNKNKKEKLRKLYPNALYYQ